MPQQLLSFPAVDPLQENWDASLQAAIASLTGAMRSFKMTILSQGSHTTPSVVGIQLCDGNGDLLSQAVYVRIRVTDNGGFLAATHATIAVFVGTLVETITANKDLVVLSSVDGLIELTCTDTTIETFNLDLAPASVSPAFADHHNSLTVTHA